MNSTELKFTSYVEQLDSLNIALGFFFIVAHSLSSHEKRIALALRQKFDEFSEIRLASSGFHSHFKSSTKIKFIISKLSKFDLKV